MGNKYNTVWYTNVKYEDFIFLVMKTWEFYHRDLYQKWILPTKTHIIIEYIKTIELIVSEYFVSNDKTHFGVLINYM